MNRKIATAVAAALLAAWAAPAAAGEAGAPQAERPWAHGVAPEKQNRALELFREGNGLLKESVFVQAAAKYREALEHWDHPAIHYNLVLALLNLDQPLEVHEHLVAAMKYGAEPLDPEKYERARSYKVLVEKQLARVEVGCEVAGAQVAMDGRPLFVAPGRWEGFVRAGPHSIVASREGYLTNEISRALPAGETSTFDLKLYTATDLTQYRRRWSGWVPWAVVGAGAAVALAGGGMHSSAIADFRAFDADIEACGGCVPTDPMVETRERGNAMQALAIGSYAVGGAAVVTGAVLLYLNRLQPYQVGASESDAQQAETISIAPFVGRDSRGMWAVIRF